MQIYPQPQWRVRFDIPHSFATEPGYARTLHAHDFRPEKGALTGCWQDPNTGMIMLRPSWYGAEWSASFKTISDWSYQSGLWAPGTRGAATGHAENVLTSIYPPLPASGENHFGYLIELTAGIVGNVIARASDDVSDALVWALKSGFTLADDEGFVIHHRPITDDLHRFQNWFSVQWGHVQIHAALDGTMRVYLYDRDTISGDPVLFDEFELTSPGELANRDGYIIFQPVPGFGLNIYHSHSPQRHRSRVSSANAGTTRGHLCRIPSEAVGSSNRLIRSSAVQIAVNPSAKMRHMFGFHLVRYPASGTYLAEAFQVPYKVSQDPSYVLTSLVPVAYAGTSATAELRTGDPGGSSVWSAATGPRARVKITLATTDDRYSPILLGWTVRWDAVLSTRDTTPLEPDALYHLEWSEDLMGRIEGLCTVRMESAEARHIVERGDTTWILERCDDPLAETPVWETECSGYAGGIARLVGQATMRYELGSIYYVASFKLMGMERRWEELVQLLDTAFDAGTIENCLDLVLRSTGFGAGSGLSALAGYTIPGVRAGNNWRFATKRGDRGDEIVAGLLGYARGQWREWRLRYNWDDGEWVLSQRPRDAAEENAWILTTLDSDLSGPASADGNTGSPKTVLVAGSEDGEAFHLHVDPPDFNVLQCVGYTSVEPGGEQVPGPVWLNVPSRDDSSSLEYLGRAVTGGADLKPVKDPVEIAKWTRRIADVAGHRRINVIVHGSDFFKDLTTSVRVLLRGYSAPGVEDYLLGSELDPNTNPQGGLWLTKRTITVKVLEEGWVSPQITYTLSNLWESGLD